MSRVESIAALEALYGAASPNSLRKVTPHLTEAYAGWIARSRFCLVATVGPDGTDVSPRGDDGPVVRIDAPDRLCLPDWRGNNRLDSLRNIVRDGRISLLFMVPGSEVVVRVNGRATVDDDADLCAGFARGGKLPRTVVVVEIAEVYFQCAKALMRSKIWARDDTEGLPSAGQLLRAATDGSEDADRFDADWPRRAAETMW